jgi:hypothetical protein
VIVRDMNDEVGRRREMERFRAVADATTTSSPSPRSATARTT